MEKKKREEQFDLLRVLCCIMIILLHCGSGYAEEKFISEVPKYYALIGRFYETITRVAVPCFVMMSGRFLLSDERNKKYGYFYKKSFYKLGVPALAFSILYVLYAYAQLVLATMLEIETNKGWSDPTY